MLGHDKHFIETTIVKTKSAGTRGKRERGEREKGTPAKCRRQYTHVLTGQHFAPKGV